MAGTVNVDTDVIDLALGHLQEVPILNANDRRPEVMLMRRKYPLVRDREIKRVPWNCAVRRTTLSCLADAPQHTEWRYRYALPGDCLRVLPLSAKGKFSGSPITHVVEGTELLSDVGPTIPIRFLSRVPEAIWSPELVDVISLALASAAAHAITQKSSMVEDLAGLLKQARSDAAGTEALEGDDEEPYADDYQKARFGLT